MRHGDRLHLSLWHQANAPTSPPAVHMHIQVARRQLHGRSRPQSHDPSQLEQPAYIHTAHGINPACKLPAAADLHIGVVCRQLHGGRDNFAAKVLVDQARAGELGGKAVAKHLAEAALVVVKPQGLCVLVAYKAPVSRCVSKDGGGGTTAKPALVAVTKQSGPRLHGHAVFPSSRQQGQSLRHAPGSYVPPTSTTTSSVFSSSGSRVRTTSAPANRCVCCSRKQPSASSQLRGELNNGAAVKNQR